MIIQEENKKEMKHLKAVRIQGLQTRLQRNFSIIALNEEMLNLKIEEGEGDMKTKRRRMGGQKAMVAGISWGTPLERRVSRGRRINSFKVIVRKLLGF